jgi:predicted RNA-binding Zn-ribbon protein involved in translation (DUF1610 family)
MNLERVVMGKTREINRGYLDRIRNLPPPKGGEAGAFNEQPSSLSWKFGAANSGVLPTGVKRQPRPGRIAIVSGLKSLIVGSLRKARRLIYKVGATALVLGTSILLGAWLKVYLWMKTSRTAPFNERAVEHVPEFVEQYPLHLYPIVLKSFELAFLGKEVDLLVGKGARFLEIAIGEGTFSTKIFPRDAGIVGFDLNPYSLSKAVQMPHVKEAVICDSLCPPIKRGHFDVIIANNFLHHVTMKKQALAHWSGLVRKLIFNESTPYWASSWVGPFMMKKLGFKRAAQRASDKIERKLLQCLEPREVLDELVGEHYDIVSVATYLSERTFFLCALYSFIVRSYGPPTPPRLKRLFLSRYLRWLTIPLTTGIARMLIRYDQFQDRSKDAYVSYVCESRDCSEARAEHYLVCPRCGGELSETDRCQECRKQYSRRDQMLFLLPEEMEFIERTYDSETARLMPREHL